VSGVGGVVCAGGHAHCGGIGSSKPAAHGHTAQTVTMVTIASGRIFERTPWRRRPAKPTLMTPELKGDLRLRRLGERRLRFGVLDDVTARKALPLGPPNADQA
jgi:hypothetical protein